MSIPEEGHFIRNFEIISHGYNNIEDSVQYSIALLSQMDGIVTRNLNDYKKSEVPVWLPDQIVEILDAE